MRHVQGVFVFKMLMVLHLPLKLFIHIFAPFFLPSPHPTPPLPTPPLPPLPPLPSPPLPLLFAISPALLQQIAKVLQHASGTVENHNSFTTYESDYLSCLSMPYLSVQAQ